MYIIREKNVKTRCPVVFLLCVVYAKVYHNFPYVDKVTT